MFLSYLSRYKIFDKNFAPAVVIKLGSKEFSMNLFMIEDFPTPIYQ